MSSGATMLPEARRRLIAARLRERGSVSIGELAAEFDISPMTVRRDLGTLARQGVARRTHGGAVAPGMSTSEDSFSQRLETAAGAKTALAAAAVVRIETG